MLNWFFDHNATVYLLLGIAAVALGAMWWHTSERRAAKGLIGVLVALVAFGAIDLVYSGTPRRQIKRAIEEMAAAVKTKEIERIFLHISDDFRYGATDKQAFRKFADDMITTGRVSEVKVWQFERAELKPAVAGGKETATIGFSAKPHTDELPSEPYFRVLAHFVRDPDGQWRLSGFEIFMQPSNQPVHIPQLPLG